jgi:hypothetical protein
MCMTEAPQEEPDFRPRIAQQSAWTILLGIYYAIICIVSYLSVAVLGVSAIALARPWSGWGIAQILAGIAGATSPIAIIASVVVGFRRRAAMEALRNAYAVLVLVVMPVWGILLNHSLSASCVLSACWRHPTGEVRSLGEPGVLVMALLHAAVVIAFAVSRRRPEALHPRAEPWVHATLLAGIVLHVLIAVHFGPDMIVGGLFFPLGGAAISPVLTVLLLLVELRARLRRRGGEAAQPPPVKLADPFRGAELHAAPASPRVDGRLLAVSAARVPVVLGVYALAAALIQHDRYGAVAAFTQTCNHTFSRIPLEHMPVHGDCHYLCTVAARGHTWLARPERIGVRRGRPILVNRQLAIANAFEDLLHERWPRFGAFARRTYDKLGYPVSKYIRSRWLADVVLILMKPAELAFFVFLLLADRRSPEQRIDRMYR